MTLLLFAWVVATRGHLRRDLAANLSDLVPASLLPSGQIEIRTAGSDGVKRAASHDVAGFDEASGRNDTVRAARSDESLAPGDLLFFESGEVATERFQMAMSRFRSAPVLLVLARFREKVTWVYNRSFPILIINRGEADIHEEGDVNSNNTIMDYDVADGVDVQEERLDTDYVRINNLSVNEGRESYVYVDYILKNYDQPQNIPDIVAFCQATPHYYKTNTRNMTLHPVPKYIHIDAIDKLVDDMKRLKALVTKNIEDWPTNLPFNKRWSDIASDVKRDGFAFLGETLLPAQVYEPSGRFHTMEKLLRNLVPECKTLWGQQFGPGGCFAVTKKKIFSKPKQWYKQLLGALANSKKYPGLMCERAWACLFLDVGRQCTCNR